MKLLFVEDCRIVTLWAKEWFKDNFAGLEVLCATSSKAAIDILANHEVDIVALDFHLGDDDYSSNIITWMKAKELSLENVFFQSASSKCNKTTSLFPEGIPKFGKIGYCKDAEKFLRKRFNAIIASKYHQQKAS